MFETSVYKKQTRPSERKSEKWFGVDPGKWGGPG